MKLTSFLAIALSFSLVTISFLTLSVQTVSAQDTKIALQRGFRTGYSDGYMSGYRDAIDNEAKSYDRHNEYAKADRAYNSDYGKLEDYRDGYQQGFESGYDSGFAKSSFDATLPSNLGKRGIVAANTKIVTTTTKTTIDQTNPKQPEVNTVAKTTVEEIVDDTEDAVEDDTAEIPTQVTTTETPTQIKTTTTTTVPKDTVADNQTDVYQTTTQKPTIIRRTDPINSVASGEDIIVIPTDTELIVELLDDLSTDKSRVGDKFTARVVSPYELTGAIIEGRITRIQEPGRIKRRSELLLSFDRIIIGEDRWSNFNASVTEILPSKGDNVKQVDIEGTVEGKSSLKEDIAKVGATTGTGLIIGAVAGGPVGAAVGAGVGAAFGVGAVVIERGKHIELRKNQQVRIKTVYETQIR